MSDSEGIPELLADESGALESWAEVENWSRSRYGRDPSVESLLFLIGIHSREGDFSSRLKKEMKQDLIMEGTHAVFETIGLYRREEAGWKRVAMVPVLSKTDQERLLRIAIARYLKPMTSTESSTQ